MPCRFSTGKSVSRAGGRLKVVQWVRSQGPNVRVRLQETGGNIIEVYHQRMFYNVPAKQAEVDVVIETKNASHVHEMRSDLVLEHVGERALERRGDHGDDHEFCGTHSEHWMCSFEVKAGRATATDRHSLSTPWAGRTAIAGTPTVKTDFPAP